MKDKKPLSFAIVLLFFNAIAFCAPLYSPTWGFSIDLPEGYQFTGGDKRDRFSFEHPSGAKFDIIIYPAAQYPSTEELAIDVNRRLNSSGGMDSFEYRDKEICILELAFTNQGAGGRTAPMEGWAVCTELGKARQASETAPRPLLLAMAYGPKGRDELMGLHFSALDSLAPEESDKLAPGIITEFSYPRETSESANVFGFDINAVIYREDAEAAQALIDREFQVLRLYENAPDWKEAWIRFYRAIYRDSFDRLSDIAFQVERKLNVPALESRELADKALQWVQSFEYERDFAGSDFQNLVTAATEGRGDCDSRAMLWAIILKQADIPSAIMVSRQYSHAMGLADLPGPGARFELEGQKLLVAETTAKVSIGLIGETVSDIEGWIGVAFE